MWLGGGTDREHMSVLVCFLKHIFLSLSVWFSLCTHLHSAPTNSPSLSPSSPLAIGPSMTSSFTIACIVLHEVCMCVWREWYTGGLYMCSSYSLFMFVYLFVALECLSGVDVILMRSGVLYTYSWVYRNTHTHKQTCTLAFWTTDLKYLWGGSDRLYYELIDDYKFLILFNKLSNLQQKEANLHEMLEPDRVKHFVQPLDYPEVLYTHSWSPEDVCYFFFVRLFSSWPNTFKTNNNLISHTFVLIYKYWHANMLTKMVSMVKIIPAKREDCHCEKVTMLTSALSSKQCVQA